MSAWSAGQTRRTASSKEVSDLIGTARPRLRLDTRCVNEPPANCFEHPWSSSNPVPGEFLDFGLVRVQHGICRHAGMERDRVDSHLHRCGALPPSCGSSLILLSLVLLSHVSHFILV